MFANYAWVARVGLGGKASAGKPRDVLTADRTHGRVTAVWQRNPISGRLELAWQSALETRGQRDADDIPSRQFRSSDGSARAVRRHRRAAVDIIQPGSRAA
jgi:hypothetical protein